MPPKDDLLETCNNAIHIAKSKITECHDKYSDDLGIGDKITNKLCDVLDVLEAKKILLMRRPSEYYESDMLYVIFNLALLTGMLSSYLQKGNLNKDQMIELNQIYRKYKNEKK